MTTEPPDPAPPTPPLPATRRWLAGCGGAALAVLCVGLYWLFTLGGGLSAVTVANLDAARARWQAHKPAGYDLDVRVQMQDTATFSLQVRGGEVVAATRNGVALPRRIWDTWDVPGMFNTMATDLETCAVGAPGSPAGNLVLRGEFDPAVGFPRRYQRIQLNPSREASWEVIRWEVVEGP